MTDLSRELTAHIRHIESCIDSATGGLPEELFLFVSRITPLVNVDLLIQDDRKRTLLTWRDDRFFGPGWHVPGGIIRYKEMAGERIRIVGKRELGAAIDFDPNPILVDQEITAGRRDRAHAIALLYRCRLASELDPRRRCSPETPSPDQWMWHDRCPENLIPEQRAYAAFMG